MLFFAHTLGCFWFGISSAAGGGAFGEPMPTWIESYGGGEDEEVAASSHCHDSIYHTVAVATFTIAGANDSLPVILTVLLLLNITSNTNTNTLLPLSMLLAR